MALFGRKKREREELEQLEQLKGDIKSQEAYRYESLLNLKKSRLSEVEKLIRTINSPEAIRACGSDNQTKIQVLAMLENEAISIREEISILEAKKGARVKLDDSKYAYDEEPVLKTAQEEIETAMRTARSSVSYLISDSKERGGFHRKEKDQKVRDFLYTAELYDHVRGVGMKLKGFKELAIEARSAAEECKIREV